ncbi:hypothetical protein [Paenibacillus terrae]|uniref:Uncharacterized protein n=1 Tax=Paenibacillus terrae TaxID=159743 RepID=A0A0D7WVF3_9BACL|nr:hypothetical protein [Paenibacillus terrae]KJD42959.1 hypothetical protein QD47_25410 [Paenibacillus terrae]
MDEDAACQRSSFVLLLVYGCLFDPDILMCLVDVVGREGEETAFTEASARRLIEKISKSAVAYSKRVLKMKQPFSFK